ANKVLTILPMPEAAGVVICQGSPSTPMNAATVCPDKPPVSIVKSPSAGDTVGTGTAWASPGNVNTNNNAYATASLATGFSLGSATSQALEITGFGFSVPTNATILGIEANISRMRDGATGFFGAGEVVDNSVRL